MLRRLSVNLASLLYDNHCYVTTTEKTVPVVLGSEG